MTRRMETPRTTDTRQSRASGGGTWLRGAIKHPGAETKAAKKAGETTHEYAEEHKHDSGKAGNRARLALTLEKMHHKG